MILGTYIALETLSTHKSATQFDTNVYLDGFTVYFVLFY